jgi:hypothetical protein
MISEDNATSKARYIRVAAIDIAIIQGMRKIKLSGSFKSRQADTVGTTPATVASKSQMTPWFHKIRPEADAPLR